MKQYLKISPTEEKQGILDFSHLLDAPAGKHGFVRAKNSHLYFEDGTRAKFLGFNIAARSNTPSHEDADKLARHFASMGVNVIRLHAADAPIGDGAGNWSSSRETPLLDYKQGSSRLFHPEGLDRFDYLIASLKNKGIYLHIDLIVARVFTEADNLEYPGNVPSCTKRYPVFNARLIALQKEYAKELLCHINPYTGLALKDDPAVITVQITNEESALRNSDDNDPEETLKPYQEEVSRRFGHFLLMKYHTREKLAEAWTHDGICALGDDEDPVEGTVRGIAGGFYQSVNEPTGAWDAWENPARYADFMEFGVWINRSFYQDMKEYLRSLGVKAPIAASNLVAGAADVFGHIDGDLMENDSYFNHPILPVQNDTYMVYGPAEYVSTNPLTIQQGVGALGTTLVSLASVAAVGGKPFMLSEWNEYGLHPFHSTAFVHTVAYACLNDWDGLILYNHHTADKPEEEPADGILTIFDAFNDPALISQWGFMASIFLQNRVSPAKNHIDVVYTKNDWKTLPNFNAMPMCFFPYISALRSVFLTDEDSYNGDAQIAVNAGFLNGGGLRNAEHAVYYAWSPYRDAMRRYPEDARLKEAAKGTKEVQSGVHLGDQALVFDNIADTAHFGDYREFASILDRAMKEWGLIENQRGYVDGCLISDTGEIFFDPDHARFALNTPYCSYFSGAPEEETVLSEKICAKTANERISLALLPLDKNTLSDAKEFLLTAIGTTGTDQRNLSAGPELMPGIHLTLLHMDGKLFAETMEGSLVVKAKTARLIVLDPKGCQLGEVYAESQNGCIYFDMPSHLAGVQYHLIIEE